MGYPTRHGPLFPLIILLAACGASESPRNPLEPPDVASSPPVTGHQVVIHVDAGAAPGGNGSGRSPFLNLPEAVAAAHAVAGAVVIQVAPGDYPLAEPLVIERPLELRGSTEQVAGADPWPTGEAGAGTETRVYASNPLGSYSLVLVGRSDGGVLTGVSLSGFVFQGTPTSPEVSLTRVQDYSVANNVFRAPAGFALQSIASSGRVTGNHFSGASTGAVLAGGYPASPSTVTFTGNRAVNNILGGLLLVGASYDIPELGDALTASVRDNDLSDNTVNSFAFGLRIFLLRRDPSSQSSSRVQADVTGNRINGNRIGITIDAGFPYRQVGAACDTRVFTGAVDLTLAGNTESGSLLTPSLVTFTRNVAALTPSFLPQWQYMHAATFMISDRDGTLANAWIDHPASDPLVGPCPGDATQEPLDNTFFYNGVELLEGRNF